MIEKLERLSGSSWTVGIGLSLAIGVILLVAVTEGRGEYDLNSVTQPVAVMLAIVTFPAAMLSMLAAFPVAEIFGVNVAFVVGFSVWMVLALPCGIALDYLLRWIHRGSSAFIPALLAGGLAGYLFAAVLPRGVYPGTGTGISTSGPIGGLLFLLGLGAVGLLGLFGLVMSIRRDLRDRGLPILAAAGGALLAMTATFF